MDGNRQHVDSNGNRVNVGNFDSNGLNVNNNWDDNRNSNIGVSSARKSSLYPRTGIPTSGGYSLYRSLVDLIQPPSIRPISSTNCCRVAYFLLSMVFTSFMSRQFLHFIRLACGKYSLENIKYDILAPLPDGIPVLLRNGIAVPVEGFVQIVSFFEDWYVEVVHNMKIYRNIFERIVSAENLFTAWDAFKDDKQNRRDVQTFEWRLEQNIFSLYYDLRNKTYRHGPYKGFWIRDPKQRHIHKASVRDRVLHHAIFSIINPIFEETFIPNSFSCRVGFGTHKGIAVLEGMTRAVAQNGIRPCFVLKCDIKKFFDSVNHDILLEIFRKKIKDENAMGFLTEIVESYTTPTERERERERERKYRAAKAST